MHSEKLIYMNSSLKMVNFCLQVTSESFIDGGFFKTGDTVTLDEEGYFIILGRKYHFTRMHTYFFLLAIFITSWCYCLG